MLPAVGHAVSGGSVGRGLAVGRMAVRGKILVVDDSTVAQSLYRVFLARYKNCEIRFAANGLEAMDRLTQEEGIALILLDLNMPVMNGFEFLQLIQNEPAYRSIPVLVVSSQGEEPDEDRALRMGAAGYLKKPFQASELFRLIEETVRPPRSRSEG